MFNHPQRKSSLPPFYVFKNLQPFHEKTKPIKIMIIDDNKKDADLAQDLLVDQSHFQFHFSYYRNPKEAIQQLQTREHPDLILLDFVMPCMNGGTVLKTLKETVSTQNIPVIIHSSMNNYETIQKTNMLQAHSFFAKPLNVGYFEKFLLNQPF